MCSLKVEKERFERNKVIYESALLTFKGVDGWDVYNCSVPFTYKGEVHLYGRVEKRSEWANSHVRLFVRTGKDEYTVVPDVIFQLEDPYVSIVKEEMIFGGTHVQKVTGQIKTYFGYFYHGLPARLTYFTTGPDSMKDIRVVELRGGKIGVFSRPRTGNVASIGFTIISNINELSDTVIAGATAIPVLEEGTWGGVNQPYLLSNGKIGCIAHASYEDNTPQGILKVYVNYSFVLDPVALRVEDAHIIGTKSCYPEAPAKVPDLIDCVFTSGIVMRRDGKCDLYSGVGDTHQGRITIDYPFRGQGTILSDLTFNPPFAKL